MYLLAKDENWTPFSHHMQKLTQEGCIRKCKTITVKLLKGNIKVNLCGFGLGNGSLVTKAQVTKEKKIHS